jgi:hypothetical protein
MPSRKTVAATTNYRCRCARNANLVEAAGARWCEARLDDQRDLAALRAAADKTHATFGRLALNWTPKLGIFSETDKNRPHSDNGAPLAHRSRPHDHAARAAVESCFSLSVIAAF